jgi:Zn-dependent M28 family amino/carboxypeptidase
MTDIMKKIGTILQTALYIIVFISGEVYGWDSTMIDVERTQENLRAHLETLTRTIGERSVAKLWNLEKAAKYIESSYDTMGIQPTREPYPFRKGTVANIVAEVDFSRGKDPKVIVIGAHYDSLSGTVGADDNGSAVAVQLEVARELARLKPVVNKELVVRFISFALEEPPAYATWSMGSRVYARKAKKSKEKIDGMICLEMVGFTCHEPGCQGYPFPLMYFDYPETGDYIGIVGNFKSRHFTRDLRNAFARNDKLPVVTLTVPWSGYLIPNVRLSDHAAFWDEGYNAVMITDTAFYRNSHYHQRTDTMDKLDYSFMSELVHSLLLYLVGDVAGPFFKAPRK